MRIIGEVEYSGVGGVSGVSGDSGDSGDSGVSGVSGDSGARRRRCGGRANGRVHGPPTLAAKTTAAHPSRKNNGAARVGHPIRSV
jgi:hypothetical protein